MGQQASDVLRGFRMSVGISERVSESTPATSERGTRNEELLLGMHPVVD